jgi:hypothetical protein
LRDSLHGLSLPYRPISSIPILYSF